jgi:aryl-alcohol dehydrogenase-like predicted oxidoreductase
MGQFALKWILMNSGVTCAIPGGKTREQVEQNCAASDLAPLSGQAMHALQELYDRRISPHVHDRW